MHELDRIEQALSSAHISHQLFERCAQDLLIETYPGLSPIPGGTDWGRDADIPAGAEPPIRLLATTSRTLQGVRKNMIRGLRSMKNHGVAYQRIVLANPAVLSELHRQALVASAKKEGARIEAVYDRTFFASRLRRDGEWRSRLLGLSGEPISLSRLPSDLAESPWAQLPLLGRDADLDTIRAAQRDLIVTGPPGVGKTRLLAEADDVVFVDRDAAIDRIADDLRWLQPSLVVIDDARGAEGVVRELVRFRQIEPDLASYRILAVCWPDEVEHLHDLFQGADVVQLDLLERSHLDQLLLAMGITGQLARSEILDQAEGRPGWAVALGDTLLKARNATSLLSGKALLGEVQRYLRRASVSIEAVDVLATVSAIGGVSESELGELAEELKVSRPHIAKLLTDAAKGGLVDVESQVDRLQDRYQRRFTVRPPMLADVLVAERAFVGDVPGIDFDGLRDRWPDRLDSLAEAAIDSVLLGVRDARPQAQKLYQRVLTARDLLPERKLELTQRFARVDREAGEQVLQVLRSNFDALESRADRYSGQAEPLVDLAYLLARWFLLDGAVELLLDASEGDKRPTNPHPGHPLRKLADLAHSFHPELPPPRDQRDLLANVAGKWLDKAKSDNRWSVYAEAVQAALSLHLRSTLAAPGDPRQFHWIETVVDPDEIRRIYEEIWPPMKRRLSDAPVTAIRSVVQVAEDWLRIGGGYDQPFGRSHPQASITAARELGEKLLLDLVPLAQGHPGIAAYLRDIAERHDLSLELQLSPTDEVFFADVDKLDDWQASVKQLQESIASVVSTWVGETPDVVIRRLLDLHSELEISNVRWPDRVLMACEALASQVEVPLGWADTALEHDLFPAASPFVERAVQTRRRLGVGRLRRYLATPGARWATLAAVLAGRSTESDRSVALSQVTAGDYQLLKGLAFRKSLSADRQRELLTIPPAGARGAAAAAMFAKGGSDRETWTPGELETEWLEAIRLLDPRATTGFQDYEAAELVSYMSSRYPQELTQWIRSRLDAGSASGEVYESLSHGAWQTLHVLPHEAKDELWSTFADSRIVRWLLGREMVGDDVEWLHHAVDRDVMTPEEALDTYNGLGLHMSIEDLARLLVPKGVEPSRIAYLAQTGTWSGEESHRYSQLLEMFSDMAKSPDASVGAVGKAGVEIFSAARDEALREEHKQRIRGEI